MTNDKGLSTQSVSWAKVALMIAGTIACWLLISTFFSQFVDSSLAALFVGLLVTSNLALLLVLVNVWLVRKHPSAKNLLEKLPGVAFAVPVPAHIRSKFVVAEQKDELAIRRAAISVEQADFTLGTLAFEPPEPIRKVGAVVHDSVVSADSVWPSYESTPEVVSSETLSTTVSPQVSDVVGSDEKVAVKGVENAFLRGRSHGVDIKKQNQRMRFRKICRILKQANEEVTVWTDKEIDALADYRLSDDSSDHDMIALLLPQRVVKFYSDRASQFKFHAQLFNSLLMVTGKELDIARVDSSKSLETSECELSFEYNGEVVEWKFEEDKTDVSESFLTNAMYWIGQHAQGVFVPIDTPGKSTGYVFVLNRITKELSVSTAFV